MVNNTRNKSNSATTNHRLPCRGCTVSCKNYESCEGKPWRLPPNTVPNKTPKNK